MQLSAEALLVSVLLSSVCPRASDAADGLRGAGKRARGQDLTVTPEYHLAPAGDNSCDSGSTPVVNECEPIARDLLQELGMANYGVYEVGTYGSKPPGCSVDTGGGLTPKIHENTLDDGSNSGSHQLVCSGEAGSTTLSINQQGGPLSGRQQTDNLYADEALTAIVIDDDGLSSRVKNLNDTLQGATEQLRQINASLGSLAKAVAAVDHSALQAKTSLDADAVSLANLSAFGTAFGTTVMAASSALLNGKSTLDNSNLSEVVIVRAGQVNETLQSHAIDINTRIFTKLTKLERDLRINATILANRLFQKKLATSLEKEPAQLADDLENLTRGMGQGAEA